MYKVQIENVTASYHYIPSYYVHLIMIIVMLHVLGAMLAAILDFQTLYANCTYLIYSVVTIPTIRPKKYVPK